MNKMDENQLSVIDYTMQHSSVIDVDQTGEVALKPLDMKRQPLYIPSLLEPSYETERSIHYKVIAQEGETEIVPGSKTKSKGYNGNILGPVVKLRQGQNVTIDTKNELAKKTTFHWHGLMVPEAADGGPMYEVQPNEQVTVNFDMQNEAGTYWFHPHPYGISPKQIYDGLAGMIIAEDENSERLLNYLPNDYGVDDIPLIVWDRFFDDDNQFVYEGFYDSDGNRGDTLLLNGTAMPKVTTERRWLRLRLLNAANVTNFRYKLSNDALFYQIATDGGFLNYPTGVTGITLTPGERAEVIIDLNKVDGDRVFFMVNEFEGLQIDIEDRDEVIDFHMNLSLRKNILPIIQVQDIHELPTKLFLMSGTDGNVTINNSKFENGRIDEIQVKDDYYVWRVIGTEGDGGNIIHNFHVHGTQFRVIARDGKIPLKNEMGWKDTVIIRPGEIVHLLINFPIASMYMYHCHNFAHENNGMMQHIDIIEKENE